MKFVTTTRAALAFSLLALASSSFAATITFTHSGTGSGSIGGNAFVSSAFTITGVADTANRQSFAGGYWIDHSSASIDITGVGTFTFTTATRTFFNDNIDTPGFSRAGLGGLDLFNGPTSATLNGWDMLSSIGPVGGTLSLIQWASPAVQTSGGQLLFNNSDGQGTFTAVVGQGVPDTAHTFVLFALALAAVGGLRRKLLG